MNNAERANIFIIGYTKYMRNTDNKKLKSQAVAYIEDAIRSGVLTKETYDKIRLDLMLIYVTLFSVSKVQEFDSYFTGRVNPLHGNESEKVSQNEKDV